MTYYIYALHNGKIYPDEYYLGYSKKEAMIRYRKKHGLRYKHNVKFYNAIGGEVFN